MRSFSNCHLMILVFLVCLSLVPAACGEEGEGESGGGGDEDGDGMGVVIDEVGASFRFSMIEVVEPIMSAEFGGTTYDVNEMVNEEMAAGIAAGDFNGILQPLSEDILAFPYDMRFSMAERSGEDYVLSDETEYAVPVDSGDSPRRFTTADNLEVVLPLGHEMVDELTLRDLLMRGTYTESLDAIESGFIAGAISKDQAEQIVIYQGFTLADGFLFLGVLPDYTFSDGSKGYSFVISYEAEEVTVVDGM